MEIERKWRLNALPARIAEYRATHISQGYLAVEDCGEVRLRNEDDRRFTLTVKSGGNMIREEQEIVLNSRLGFDLLWKTVVGRPIIKRRFTFSEDDKPRQRDRKFEFDQYDGHLAGLLILEVEFFNEASAQEFILPEWIGATIEVTTDKRYKNKYLALNGCPTS